MLKILADRKLSRKLRRSILKHGPDSLIVCLCGCCYNLARGNVPINETDFSHLKKFGKWIHNVADLNSTALKKRKFLLGGSQSSKKALDLALPVILELIINYFSEIN